MLCTEAFAVDSDPRSRDRALAWVAMLGDARAQARLLSGNPSPAWLWATALTGRVQAVDRAIEMLEDETLARHAGEVIHLVAGLPRHDERFWLDNGAVAEGDDPDVALPKLDDDDLEAELAPLDDRPLPLPNPETIRLWWEQQRGRLDAEARLSLGLPFDGRQLLHDLRKQSMRLRHSRALELAARTGGVAQIESRALTAVQSAQIESLADQITQVQCQRGLPI
ncbi:MAG: hypothetical protein KC431_32150 [Myxococcales bacterium]|nr:hypothetical protein [Myxococcales bacterium]